MSGESDRIQRKYEEAKRRSAAARRRGVPVTGEMRRAEASLARQVATNRRKQAEAQRRQDEKDAKKAKRIAARTAARLAAAEQARADRRAQPVISKARARAMSTAGKCPACKGRKTNIFGFKCGRCKGTGAR